MPAAQPRTAHTTGTWTVHSNGISRCACAGQPALDAAGPRLAVRAGALRATMSNPPQKCSPAPSSRIDPHPSSLPAPVDRGDEREHHLVVDARCASPAGRGAGAAPRRRSDVEAVDVVALIGGANSSDDRGRARPADRAAPPADRAAGPARARGSAAGSWRGPGVVTSPRWLSAPSSRSTAGRSPVGEVRAGHAARAATACRRRS